MSLFIGLGTGGVAQGQGVASGNNHPTAVLPVYAPSAYQWRPTGSYPPPAVPSAGGGVTTSRNGEGLLPGRYSPDRETPPGTYRPLEGAHPIPPQPGAYRFRTITPEEQSQIGQLSGPKAKPVPRPVNLKFRGDDVDPPVWAPGTRFKPQFRPDKRFPDTGAGQKFLNAPYNSVLGHPSRGSAPVFRPGR